MPVPKKAPQFNYFIVVSGVFSVTRFDDRGQPLPASKNVPIGRHFYLSTDAPVSEQDLFQNAIGFLFRSTHLVPDMKFIWDGIDPNDPETDQESVNQVCTYLADRFMLGSYYARLDPHAPEQARPEPPQGNRPPPGKKKTTRTRH